MRLRGINSFFAWLANNPFIIVLAALASTLSYFTGFRTGVQSVCNLVGLSSKWIIEIVTFCILLFILAITSSIIGYFIDRRYRKALRIYSRSVESVIWADATGERIAEFQKLRSKAKDSMLVMGIGLTFLSQDLEYIKALLEKNLAIRLLMINPSIMSATFNTASDDHSISIKPDFFERYFERNSYVSDIKASLDRVTEFILNRKIIENKKGKVSLKTYPYFISMNATIIDGTGNSGQGQMLIEWCLPFSTWRISSRLSRSQHKEFFDVVNKNIEELWNRSQLVIDDTFEP